MVQAGYRQGTAHTTPGTPPSWYTSLLHVHALLSGLPGPSGVSPSAMRLPSFTPTGTLAGSPPSSQGLVAGQEAGLVTGQVAEGGV